MAFDLQIDIDRKQLRALDPRRLERSMLKAMRRAGSTALRDMRSEASKRVRRRKRIKAKAVREALIIRRPKGKQTLDSLDWRIDVRHRPVRVSDYPHRQTRRGVSVAINRGKRTVIKGAFVATMRSGHRGVFVRRGARRLPIDEVFASRVVDALLHRGEADGVLERGRKSLVDGYHRLLRIELGKLVPG